MKDEEQKKMAQDLAYIRAVLQALVETPSSFQKHNEKPATLHDFFVGLSWAGVILIITFLIVHFC